MSGGHLSSANLWGQEMTRNLFWCHLLRNGYRSPPPPHTHTWASFTWRQTLPRPLKSRGACLSELVVCTCSGGDTTATWIPVVFFFSPWSRGRFYSRTIARHLLARRLACGCGAVPLILIGALAGLMQMFALADATAFHKLTHRLSTHVLQDQGELGGVGKIISSTPSFFIW